MRSVGSELLSVAVTLSIPLGIVAVFPFGAFGFRASENVRPSAKSAIVMLAPEAERQALRMVRASWRGKSGETRRLRAELFSATLPDDGRGSVLSVRDRSRPPSPSMALCERTPFLPSQQAPPPSPIAADATADQLPFPRETLLKMN